MALNTGIGRIPNLPFGEILDDQGKIQLEEKAFRQALITSLQNNFGDEGVVIPGQTTNDIDIIQNNKKLNTATGELEYTCQFGTMLYDITLNKIVVAVDDGSGAPVFKTINLT